MKEDEKVFAIYHNRVHCGNRPAKNAEEAVRIFMKESQLVGSTSSYKAIEAIAGRHYGIDDEESVLPEMPALKLTAKQIYDKLIYEADIVCSDGIIKANLKGIDIVFSRNQTVTEIFREWLSCWFEKNNIVYTANEDVAIPLDYFLCGACTPNKSISVRTIHIYEKADFYISDFRTLAEELVSTPSISKIDYLIFEYGIDDKGELFVRDVYKKKIWQITRPMDGWPLSLQIENGKVRGVKSCDWNMKRTPKTFKTIEHFLSAVEATLYRNPQTESLAPKWAQEYQAAYKREYNIQIDIPRWADIKDMYEK